MKYNRMMEFRFLLSMNWKPRRGEALKEDARSCVLIEL